MKVTVHDWHTNIILTPEEVRHLCTPGEGADTCIWLVCGANGFECSCFHRNHSLSDRWRKGKTVAKRDGCDFVNNIKPFRLGAGEHEIKVPGISK